MKRRIFTVIITLLMLPPLISAQVKEWSLEECIRYALQNNIQLKQQEINTQYKASELELSKLSLLPSLNGYASQDFNYGKTQVTQGSVVENKDVNSAYFRYGASSEMKLFSGLKNYNTIRKSKYSLLTSEQEFKALQDNISLNISLAYLQILLNKELVNATASQLEITRQQIERTKKLVDAGSIARGSLLDIEAQAASEELLLTNQQNALIISNLTLAQMLEIDSVETFTIFVPEIDIEPVGVDGDPLSIYSIAEKTRPEVIGAEYSLKESEAALAIARGGRIPSISLNASLGSYYQKTNFLKPDFKESLKNNFAYGFGFSLNIPIFNGWQVNKNVQNAKKAIQYSEYTLEATRKTLLKNITQSYTDADGALKKFYSSKKAVVAMEEAFRYSEQKFSVGLVNAVDYNQAKAKLLNAQSEMAQAKYEYVFKTKVLDFYKGIPITLEYVGTISK